MRPVARKHRLFLVDGAAMCVTILVENSVFQALPLLLAQLRYFQYQITLVEVSIDILAHLAAQL